MASPAISATRTAMHLTLIFIISVAATEAQPSPVACISSLVPCASYLNSTNPPDSCCNPLKETVTHQLDCMCNLYKNPDFMKSFHINVTQAHALLGYCKIPVSVSSCKALAPGSSSSSSQHQAKENKTNGAESNGCVGLMSFLLMLGASLML